MKRKWMLCALFLGPVLMIAQNQTVKVTPLGSRTGEFCFLDRALLFEDPSGVRILYDPGFTVAGSDDSRLQDVHVILLSHAHGDHLGPAKLGQSPDDPAAKCDNTFSQNPTPNSNLAEIAAAKNSAVLVGAPLATVLGMKIQAIRGVPTPGCAAAGLTNELVVPLSAPCTGVLNFGAKRTVTRAAGSPGVQIAAVTAVHPNDFPSGLLTDPEKTALAANGLGGYVGLANGYILAFSTGLKVYLSGDTGLTADMDSIVSGLYKPSLAVFNISDSFVTGPEEAAFAVRKLVKASSAIASHANEVATTNGNVNSGTRTARFIELLGDIPVYVPRSGITMQFGSDGKSVNGC